MAEIYTHFKEMKKHAVISGIADNIKLVSFELNGKKYEIYFPKKRANRFSIIHCINNAIEWEQFPLLPRIAGRMYGLRVPMIRLTPDKDSIKIFVIMGKPRMITGLDDGIFRSIHKYDENYINVRSEARFKEI